MFYIANGCMFKNITNNVILIDSNLIRKLNIIYENYPLCRETRYNSKYLSFHSSCENSYVRQFDNLSLYKLIASQCHESYYRTYYIVLCSFMNEKGSNQILFVVLFLIYCYTSHNMFLNSYKTFVKWCIGYVY